MAGEIRAWGPVGEDCGRFIAAPEGNNNRKLAG